MDRVRWRPVVVSGLLGLITLSVTVCAGCAREESQSPQVQEPSQASAGSQNIESSQEPKPVSVSDSQRYSLIQHYQEPSGYKCSVEVTTWERATVDSQALLAHPANDQFVLDLAAAGYDPLNDAVFPYSVSITNTTEQFAIDSPVLWWKPEDVIFSASSASISSVFGPESAWPVLGEARSVECVDLFTEGQQSTMFTVEPPGNTALRNSGFFFLKSEPPVRASWSVALQPGQAQTQTGFLIYHDQRTPNEPDGAAWVLDHMILNAGPMQSNDQSNSRPWLLQEGFDARPVSLTGIQFD